MRAGPVGIIVDQLGAQQGLRGLGVLRALDGQELQRADLGTLADLLALGGQGELDEQLGLVQVLAPATMMAVPPTS